MIVIYRYSSSPDKKPKAFNKEECWNNFKSTFLNPEFRQASQVYIVIDHLEQADLFKPLANNMTIIRDDCSSASKSQLAALNIVQNIRSYEDVYMLEDDYMHDIDPVTFLEEGIGAFDYVTLYDHPDKYSARSPNPEVKANPRGYASEPGGVVLTRSTHWKETNSTTMTFASKAGIIQADLKTIKSFVTGDYPDDYNMFQHLRNVARRTVGSCIPGRATHAETAWLSPFSEKFTKNTPFSLI